MTKVKVIQHRVKPIQIIQFASRIDANENEITTNGTYLLAISRLSTTYWSRLYETMNANHDHTSSHPPSYIVRALCFLCCLKRSNKKRTMDAKIRSR